MNKQEILDLLSENELKDIEEIQYKDDIIVVRFYYDYDDLELESARAYANDESTDEEEGDTWFKEFFIPYLYDVAADNVGEIIEDVMDSCDVSSQYISYDLTKETYDYSEVIAIFYKKGTNVEIEEVMENLNI